MIPRVEIMGRESKFLICIGTPLLSAQIQVMMACRADHSRTSAIPGTSQNLQYYVNVLVTTRKILK